MITEKKTIVKIDTNNLEGNIAYGVQSQKEIAKFCLTFSGENGEICEKVETTGDGKSLQGNTKVKNPLLWSVATPHLYTYKAEIFYIDGEKETAEGKIAFRTLHADNRHIYLNNKPLFVRGYIRGATAHDHANNCQLSLLDFYRKNVTEAKKFGFNFIRFHSTVPPEELFQAADELGILVHIEFRKPDDNYNNLEEMLFAKRELVPAAFIQDTIDRLYEHPSLAEYCIGNELKTVPTEEIVALGKTIKQMDGSRIFIDTCAWGKLGRENVDIDVQHMSYFFPFGAHEDMFDDAGSIHTLHDEGIACKKGVSPYPVPLLAHEVCHYTALRDFAALKKKFEKYGIHSPWWIDEELKMIAAKGFEKKYDKMYAASKYFQRICWKTAFEAIRSSHILSGYHFLQLADTDVYENSNGIIDCFDDESGIYPEDFLRFSGDRVLLTKIGHHIFRGGEKVILPVNFSNFGEDEVKAADFVGEIKCGDKVLSRVKKENIDVSKKGFCTLTEIEIELPKVAAATKMRLIFTLYENGKIFCENNWNIWVYPQYTKMSYAQFVSYQKGDTMITDDIEKALDGLSQGKKVCLVYRLEWTRHVKNKTQQPPKYAFKATWNRFKPVIWDRGTNYGGLCEKDILEKYGFASDEFYDFNYSEITEDCDKVILDDFPCKVDNVIEGIDKSCRDRFDAYKVSFNLPELMYDRTLRDFSYLFGVGVGGGKLLVCGMNLTGLDSGEASAESMAQWVLRYLSGTDFAPKNIISLETLKEYMAECAKQPVKERMMTQFWELDDAPVESRQYWEESRKYLQ